MTQAEWHDLVARFESHPASRHGRCMVWRKPRDAWWGHAEENQAEPRVIVASGKAPGILAYDGERAVGCCSVAPAKEVQ